MENKGRFLKKKEQESVKVFTYRYVWQTAEGMQCKYLTGVEKEHEAFMDVLKNDVNVLAAFREYVNEIDYSKILQNETFKVKEEKKNEEIQSN